MALATSEMCHEETSHLLSERYLRLMRPINNRDTRMPASKPTNQRRKADRTDPDAGDRSPTISIGRAYNL